MNNAELQEFAAELGQSREMRNAAFELIRLWRAGWDQPGSSGYQSYLIAYRAFAELMMPFKEYKGSFIELAQEILKTKGN